MMNRYRVLGMMIGMAALASAARAAPLPPEMRRIVFLGSSSTDGHSDPLLLQQALREAQYAVPVCINAGIGGNTTAQMAARLERDVLAFSPTLVVLQLGANDAGAGVTAEAFRATAGGILARLRAARIPAVLLTTNVRGPKLAGQEATLKEYNAVIRALAQEYGARVAEVFALQEAARVRGETVLETDDLHPNYAGHRCIVRALLDALGLAQVPLPATFAPQPFRGLIPTWRLRACPAGTPALDAEAVQRLAPDTTWHTYAIPETRPHATWWLEGARRSGIAVSLAEALGPAERYVGLATLEIARDGDYFVNTGAELRAVWLDGVRLYQAGADYRGYHAGRDRLPVHLTRGPHTLVIESGSSFFVSVTTDHDW